MPITDLPRELLHDILLLAAKDNQATGETFTFGLSQPPLPLQKTKLTKYVRGPISPESLRWDATAAIRQVCSDWHDWALSYNLERIFERRWRGSERWADLSISRRNYALYELNDKPAGYAVYRDPFGSLKQTHDLLSASPAAASHVRRLWFNGFYTAETDKLILSVVASCPNLQFLSVPWTVLRRGTADDWLDLLNVNTGHGKPLYSLELTAVCLPADQARALETDTTPSPLLDPRITFSALSRLKIFGNTLHNPISDADLLLVARTATNLTCLDTTNLSTISVAGMLALVKASRHTLQVLEHSPRSDDGFYHPFPGTTLASENICTLLATGLPQMRDISLSLPYMCANLFSNPDLRWVGEAQFRTTDICGCACDAHDPAAAPERQTPATRAQRLRAICDAARALIAARARMGAKLSVELFFAGCIFEPAKRTVHGDFALAEIRSRGVWPSEDDRSGSTKGPYGTSGTYEKEEGTWDCVAEEKYLEGVRAGWIEL